MLFFSVANKFDTLLKYLGMQQFHRDGIKRRCNEDARSQQEIRIMDEERHEISQSHHHHRDEQERQQVPQHAGKLVTNQS